MDKIGLYLSSLKGKKILVQGLGLNGGGIGVANFFLKHGFDVTITDLKSEEVLARSVAEVKSVSDRAKFVLGKHREEDFLQADVVVKSPAIPPDNKFLTLAEKKGAYITSDIEIFFNIAPCPIYAITGSKGKSTTVSAVYNIFKKRSSNSFLGGNITISPLSFYEKLTNDSLVILELSSWQLRDLKSKEFRFKGAAITNLMKDHQNYYKSMDDYLSDKLIITDNQKDDDYFLIPKNDPYIKIEKIKTEARVFTFDYKDKGSNIFFDKDIAFLKNDNKEIELFRKKEIRLKGDHMELNLLVAAGFAYLGGIDLQSIKSGISDFNGAPYRMEEVRVWNGIKFVNDTTATIPDAAVKAIKAYKNPIIWIAGGNDKNLDFSVIKEISSIPKKIYLLKGDGSERMKPYLNRNDVIESDSLVDILNDIVSVAKDGDVVLLSPGCTSFGLFQNEFHRGEVFNDFVSELK